MLTRPGSSGVTGEAAVLGAYLPPETSAALAEEEDLRAFSFPKRETSLSLFSNLVQCDFEPTGGAQRPSVLLCKSIRFL